MTKLALDSVHLELQLTQGRCSRRSFVLASAGAVGLPGLLPIPDQFGREHAPCPEALRDVQAPFQAWGGVLAPAAVLARLGAALVKALSASDAAWIVEQEAQRLAMAGVPSRELLQELVAQDYAASRLVHAHGVPLTQVEAGIFLAFDRAPRAGEEADGG
jgi:hypothetical protein